MYHLCSYYDLATVEYGCRGHWYKLWAWLWLLNFVTSIILCKGHILVAKKIWYIYDENWKKHTRGFCIKSDYWRGQAPPFWNIGGGGSGPLGPPGSYSTGLYTSAFTMQKVMNAQECRTLTTTRMHDSRMCSYRSIASMSQRALATYPAPERDSGTQHRILFRVSAWYRRKGKAPGYATILSNYSNDTLFIQYTGNFPAVFW